MNEEKEKELRSIVANEPENVHAWINLGIYLEKIKKDFFEAEKIYRKAIKINPDFYGSWLKLGIFLLYNGNNIEEAIVKLKKANKLNPTEKIALYFLGIAFSETNQINKSIEVLKKAIEIDPNFENAWYKLGSLLENSKKNIDGAINAYNKVININPMDSDTWEKLGNLLYREKKDYENAKFAFEKALESNPSHIPTLFSYGFFLLEQNKKEQAEEYFLKILKNNTDNFLIKGIVQKIRNFYTPSIESARKSHEYDLGDYRAILFSDIIQIGNIKYKYIIEVKKKEDPIPISYISSEYNNMFEELGGGQFFFCAFEKTGHFNFGNSDDYGDLEIFLNLAIDYIVKKYKIDESQIPELPKVPKTIDFKKISASFHPQNNE